jgi:hypothetical protein
METCEKLAEYSTCEVSDALIKAGVPSGGYFPDITMLSPSRDDPDLRICGHAYTVRMVDAKEDGHPTPAVHFVDAIPDDAVVVISAPSCPSFIPPCLLIILSLTRGQVCCMGWAYDGRSPGQESTRCCH